MPHRHALVLLFASFGPLLGCGANVVVQDDEGGGGAGGSTNVGPSPPSSTNSTGSGKLEDVLEQLGSIEGMTLTETTSKLAGYRVFEGTFRQPANHDQPDGLQFEQRIQIYHYNVEDPTVLFSTGYGLLDFDYLSEPTTLVAGNQVAVEHRFFSPSRPEPADWQTLTIEQAAKDYHRLVDALNDVYGGRWISTGNSKGGMAALFHRRWFPGDVDGTVAYVAPLSYGVGDQRYVHFLDWIGDSGCREALKSLQIEALSRRQSLVPMLLDLGYSFTYWGANAAFDFAVEWLRFTLWQYAGPSACENIPSDDASDEELFDYLVSHASLAGMSDPNIDYFEPYYFQSATQLGDPAIDESYLQPWLSVPLGLSSASFVKPGPTKEMVFDHGAMPDIQDWVLTQADNILFIYGQNDPWSAGMFDITGKFDTHRFFAPYESHGAGIDTLLPSEEDIAKAALFRWADLDKPPPPPSSPLHAELTRVGRLADSAPPGNLRDEFTRRARQLALEIEASR